MIIKYITAALLTLTFSLGSAQAQRGPIYSANSTPIGRVTDEGDILGSNGILLATVPDPRIGALISLHVINLK